ncbi:MAG: murein biosynthesis integral membrane protein MurJ [Actinobacteria bacterium]|nr:murein biosynthesis integral membrane protein MurJ [Actinomycetota bacterium]
MEEAPSTEDTVEASHDDTAGAPPASTRRNSALVAAGILLSRISGLVREGTISHFFGLGFAADAFSAAFRIPNLMQNLLGEGVLSASFIPVYSRLLAEGREEEAGRVAGATAGLLTAVAGGLVLVGVVFARPITAVLAPGLAPATFALTVRLTRIITPGIGFLVLSAWCLGVLNSHRRFFLSYVAPVLWNGAQIGVLVALGTTVYAGALGNGLEARSAEIALITALAWGTVLGGALQFLVQLPWVLRVARGVRPSLRTDLPGVRQVARAFAPVVGGRGVVQLSAYADQILASFLAVGALAALRFSQTLYVLPISLFGMAVAAAELPELSSMQSHGREQLRSRLDEGLSRIAVFVVPTVVGFLAIGDLIVGALYQRGEFDRTDSLQVWVVLVGYSVGLVASSSSRLLQSALYGIGDPRTPAKVAVLRVVASVALGVGLMFQLDRVSIAAGQLSVVGDLPAFGPVPDEVRQPGASEQVARLGAAGLSLAAGMTAWLEWRLLRRAIRDRIGDVRLAGGQLRATLAAAAGGLVVALAIRPVVAGLPLLVAGPIAVAATGVTYLAAAHALGIPEVRKLIRRVTRIIRR